jgi:putative molybdopterin biosynthesis protein
MSELNDQLRQAARQGQFLNVIDREAAIARFHHHLKLAPLGTETVPLAEALNRVLARQIIAEVDVPAFDRASVDGFAVQAADTFGSTEEKPCIVRINAEVLTPGVLPAATVRPGTATPIATGAIVPRGADAVVMIEHTELRERADALRLEIRKPALPGQFIAFAGSDVASGETVLRAGLLLTSREIGVLAAIGLAEVAVYRRPTVAIFSTGDEIIAPGEIPRPGKVYDSNGAILAAAAREAGAVPVSFGIVPDDDEAVRSVLEKALDCDAVILSGGTSKGAGDISYRCLNRLRDPGVIVHGVAVKPGKPVCLAVTQGKPVVVLPGFPTSAIFSFHEFIAPVLRRFSGLPPARAHRVTATVPLRVNSERGRTEYLLVSLVQADDRLLAYPMGKGSGAVTAFSFADGFIAIDQHTELLPAGSQVSVQRIGQHQEPADLVFIGSQCTGLDYLMTRLQDRGVSVKALYVGSTGGLSAARRGECDAAPVHLLDPASGEYNRHLLTPTLALIPGYRRMQGLVFRPGDARFEGRTADEALAAALKDPDCSMINRNAGSGTRILIDRLLAGAQPSGYAVQPKSHNAVAAAVARGRADWGVAIDTVARQYRLGFIALQEEHYDFLVPVSRLERAAVRLFRALLDEPETRAQLGAMGFRL